MNQGRLTRQLAPEVAAYIAGLIDGEGTVTLARLHAHELTPRNGKYGPDQLAVRQAFEKALLSLRARR